jgi:CelD/BcsL family acetyltransferase involved in cellulose biosynthesis
MLNTARHIGENVPLRCEVVNDLDPIRSEWQALAERSQNVFGTWEWAWAWWEHFGIGRRLLITLCRAPEGRLVGILPLYADSIRGPTVLRFIGHGVADYVGPVCAPEDRPSVAQALRRCLDERVWRWNFLFAGPLPTEQGWSRLLTVRPRFRQSNPMLATRGRTWNEYLSSRSPNLRQQVRRFPRRLATCGGVRFRLTQSRAGLDADLDTLVRLHGLRWGGRSSSFAGARRSMHRDFAHAALHRGWLRLWTLEVGGTPVAAWYGFRFGNADWYYQAGRDPAWDRFAVGFVLLAKTIEAAFADQIPQYLFLRGIDSYKFRFAETDNGLESFRFARGPVERVALLGLDIARRLRPSALIAQPAREPITDA